MEKRSISKPRNSAGRIGELSVLPVFLDLRGKPVVVIGGSPAAAWKAELLARGSSSPATARASRCFNSSRTPKPREVMNLKSNPGHNGTWRERWRSSPMWPMTLPHTCSTRQSFIRRSSISQISRSSALSSLGPSSMQVTVQFRAIPL